MISNDDRGIVPLDDHGYGRAKRPGDGAGRVTVATMRWDYRGDGHVQPFPQITLCRIARIMVRHPRPR